MTSKQIVVAMSGGVDSSVAAALLKEQGHRVIGVTLRLLKIETGFGCCGSTRDIDDARAVCNRLGIPHYVMDFADNFKDNIIDPFIRTYAVGETPNPCIACNRFVKFSALLDKAVALGADYVATGHYARLTKEKINSENIFCLRRPQDRQKDQSYVLYHLQQKELSRLMFPLGNLEKAEVRDIARRFDLKTADKSESMEICFVPQADTKNYVRNRAKKEGLADKTFQSGEIKDTDGRVLGIHEGVAYYTRGQRQGLGLAVGKPMYVVDLIPETNTVVVGEDKETLSSDFYVGDVYWGHKEVSPEVFESEVQIRSHHKATPCTIQKNGHGVVIKLHNPQRAVTPGQAAVFYAGDRVLGGGTIIRKKEEEPIR